MFHGWVASSDNREHIHLHISYVVAVYGYKSQGENSYPKGCVLRGMVPGQIPKATVVSQRGVCSQGLQGVCLRVWYRVKYQTLPMLNTQKYIPEKRVCAVCYDGYGIGRP